MLAVSHRRYTPFGKSLLSIDGYSFNPHKGIDHLTELCNEFELWYNRWRPHMTLDGMRPDDVYFNNKPDKPERDAKTVPCDIEQHFFQQTRVMGYRLRKVA